MNQVTTVDPSRSVITRFAQTYGVDQEKVLTTLKNTCFKIKEGEVTNEQMMSLLIVAEQHKLNPFTREIYAFPDKKNGIVPVVGVDGWASIINRKSGFDGMDFNESENIVQPEGGKRCPEWIECVIYDSNREHPVKAKEYLDEVYRPPFKGKSNGKEYVIDGPWQTHTKRMLRHKAMIQCARIAYGFSGIYDPDEAERIIEAEYTEEKSYSPPRIPKAERDAVLEQTIAALERLDEDAVLEIWEPYKNDPDSATSLWSMFNSTQRKAINAIVFPPLDQNGVDYHDRKLTDGQS